MDSQIETWKGCLETIENDITHLLDRKHIFWGVVNILKDNEKIRKNPFYECFGKTYVDSAVMGIRRHIKTYQYTKNEKNKGISMARLLYEIIQNPQLISREYFQDRYKILYGCATANNIFNRIADNEGKFISKEMVERDLKNLKSLAKNIEAMADKVIAHLDINRLEKYPIFDELNNCLSLLYSLCNKYSKALCRICITEDRSLEEGDWKFNYLDGWEKEIFIPPQRLGP